VSHPHRDRPGDREPHRDRRDVLPGHPDALPGHLGALEPRAGRPALGASSRDWDGDRRDRQGLQDEREPGRQQPGPDGPCRIRRTGCCPDAVRDSDGPCRGCRTGCCPGAGPEPAEPLLHHLPGPRCSPRLRRPEPREQPPEPEPPEPEQPEPPVPRQGRQGQPREARPALRQARAALPAWVRTGLRQQPGHPCSPGRRVGVRACRGSLPRLPSVPRAWPGRPHAACAQQGPRSSRPPTSHTHRSR
jgi:hypothetical protein